MRSIENEGNMIYNKPKRCFRPTSELNIQNNSKNGQEANKKEEEGRKKNLIIISSKFMNHVYFIIMNHYKIQKCYFFYSSNH